MKTLRVEITEKQCADLRACWKRWQKFYPDHVWQTFLNYVIRNGLTDAYASVQEDEAQEDEAQED